MVALGILAGAMLAISDIVGASLRNHVRARDLEVATLLARAKMAALEEQYEDKGFKTFDEDEEGTFEDDGHPDFRWKVEVKKPTVELGPDQVINLLTGSTEGLAGLLGAATGAGASGSSGSGSGGTDRTQQMSQLLGPLQGMITSAMQGVATKLGEQLKTGVRQVTLTVTWPEAGAEEHLSVTTQMVVLAPGQAAQAAPASVQAAQQQAQQAQQQGAQGQGTAPQGVGR